jgi:tetratricopeptide (TPR) repeat protein
MSHRRLLVVLLLFASAAPGANQKATVKTPLPPIAPLDAGRLLDLYAAGRFDEAVQAVARAGDEIGRNLRRHWSVGGSQWILADPARRRQRILAAAALALETEHVRAERGDWRASDDPPCAAACVLDWAQQQLIDRGPPDQAERTWHLAAAALTGGVRDWRYLQRVPDPRANAGVPGLMNRALVRFPGDARLRLEEALAAAGRFNITMDGRRLPLSVPLAVLRGRGLLAPRQTAADIAADMLSSLTEDPAVGPEARLRLGYLHWVLERDEVAQTELMAAAEQARDVDLRYLARFLLGWMAIARGDSAGAIPHLEAALAARPASQSAALALASLELQRGDASKAHDLADTSLDQRRADIDPWRLFLYGHHPRLPGLIAELRREVKP